MVGLFNVYMDKKQHIKIPEGVSKLMGDLWLRHKAGLKQPENNVFWVDFPPLSEEEKAEFEAAKEEDDKHEDSVNRNIFNSYK